ncbi:hypothetical protein CVT26_014430 [Gymnopilus dilepis]|uniref:Uncharacterized protein n=1 Tax=Gymnopilus dilepis TaxID=231916 RepID=A0A409WS95_9AGAR|nr:hypothetical protein CVT26_014430 [Gymnopilus dilepis]
MQNARSICNTSPEMPREPSLRVDDRQYILHDLRAQPLYGEAEFDVKYGADSFTSHFREESHVCLASSNAQCAEQDVKEVVRRRVTMIQYPREQLLQFAAFLYPES